MTFASLFTGIGGFDLAAERLGMEIAFQCEINEFCIKILNKNFPNVPKFKNIKQMQALRFKGQIDILASGFPCQPFSKLGKRNGKDDERYLWDENMRIVRECKPRYFVGENVLGIEDLALEQVCLDKENN